MKTFFYLTTALFTIASCQQKPSVPLSLDGTEDFYKAELAPFYHGVASGDPESDRVIIWTRVTPEFHQSVKVKWEISQDEGFEQVLARGSVQTDSVMDYTVKVDVEGLTGNTAYFYRFKALEGVSQTGQTRTVNDSGEGEIVLGVVSCSNYEFGYFSAYRHLGDKDLDAIIHLGDYFYEYGTGRYGDTTVGRFNLPPTEILSLSDYRTRYALYRLDKDLRYAHQRHPFVAIWDDHEITNNAYKTGAQNHQEDEGDYEERKAIARQAYYEWLPIRDNDRKVLYRQFEFGEMADLIMLDERLEGRTEQATSVEEVDESMTMLGAEQLNWFKEVLNGSDAKWKIIGNQVIFSELDLSLLRPNSPKNLDAWDGYAVERDGIISSIDDGNIDNVIFITGDTHTSWAFDVPVSILDYQSSGHSVAVEMGTTSITSANWNERGTDEEVRDAEDLVMKSNPHLKFVNGRDHGYLLLTLSNQEAVGQWFYVDDIKDENSGEYLAKTIEVSLNSNAISQE